MLMRFKITHEPRMGVFYADIVEVTSIEPWRSEHDRQIALGKTPRWAAICGNRAMKAAIEAEWRATDAYADLANNYPAGSWREMPTWQTTAFKNAGSLLISFTDPKQALRFKLSWHDRMVERILPLAA